MDDKYVEFMVPPRTETASPLEPGLKCYHEHRKPLLHVQCTVCKVVWRFVPPVGHICVPPINPKLAWPA